LYAAGINGGVPVAVGTGLRIGVATAPTVGLADGVAVADALGEAVGAGVGVGLGVGAPGRAVGVTRWGGAIDVESATSARGGAAIRRHRIIETTPLLAMARILFSKATSVYFLELA